MTKTVSEVLNAAADLLAKPGAWTKNVYARSSDGTRVNAASSEAVCWCAVGAIHKSSSDDLIVNSESLNYLGSFLPRSIPIWNDSPLRTQFEVVKTLRKVAKQAKAEGK